ncbi:kelch-like protein 24 [Saccoglossus kowalevskii]
MMSDFSPRPPPGRYDNTPLSETFDMKTTDGEKVKSPYLFNDKKHALNLVEGLHGLQKEGKLTDTIVSIDGKEFRCHAVILLASAESWKIRLSSASEEKDGTKKIVLDEDIDATTFNHVLNFIYSGKIEATENSLYRLKDAADTLEIPMLSDYSEKVIKQEKDEREMKSKIPDNLPDEIRIYIFHQRQSEALKEEKARVAAVSMEIMKKLHEMQQEKTNTDVELKVNNELIEAHRVLLAACSPYFTAMFTSNMKESLERVVEVRNIDDSIMEKLIKYMYTGEIEMDENDSQSMLETSCLLQILPILEATGRFLANHLDPINCFSMKQYGQIHCCQSLETAADIYILEHFDDIAQQSDFLKIGLDEFTTYLKMNVCVEKEDIIYDCLMRYIRYDLENRKDSLSEMLKMIRWPFISQTFLNEKVKNDPLIVDCDELFDEAAKYHNSSIQERYGIRQKHSWSHPRSYSQVVAVICGFRTPRNVRNVQSFDPDSNKWQPIVDLPDPTFDDIVSAVKIGTDIMLFTLKGNAWLYNSSQRRWLQMKCPKNVNRFFYGAASLNDNVYLVGGKNLEGTVYKSVERYNPVTNDWDNIPEMPTGVHYPAVTSHAGELYVIGGHTAKYHSPSGAVQIFNPDTNIWRRGADIPILTFIANALSIHEYVYVVSGEYGRMQRYSPRNDRWEEAATLDQRHYLGTITVCNNKIYAIGGYSDFSHSERNISNSIECYDPQKNTWKTVSEMPTPVPWHMSVALPRCVVECHNCV